MPTDVNVEWNGISPNLKGELVKDTGVYVADPYLVLRAGIFAQQDEAFDIFSPAVTGRLERAIFIPDHHAASTQPGIGGVIDFEVFQHYTSDAPVIDVAPPNPFVDTLDLLNTLGLAVPNNAITHLTSWGIPPYPVTVRTPILPHLLIQDKLKISIDKWSEDLTTKICYVYLYFGTGAPMPLSAPIQVELPPP
jgi:hypothetical protein